MTVPHCWRSLFIHWKGWRADGQEWEEEEEHVFNPSVRPYMFRIWQQRGRGRCWRCRRVTWRYAPPMPGPLCASSQLFTVHDETLNLWSHFVRCNLRHTPEREINHVNALATSGGNTDGFQWESTLEFYLFGVFFWRLQTIVKPPPENTRIQIRLFLFNASFKITSVHPKKRKKTVFNIAVELETAAVQLF